jgi:hypothetical protein
MAAGEGEVTFCDSRSTYPSGQSLAGTIPDEIVEAFDLEPGDTLTWRMREGERVVEVFA